MKRWIIITFLFLVVNAVTFAEPNHQQEKVFPINYRFFTAVQANDFENATGMFHYPPMYSVEELDQDKKVVKSVLEYFNRSFGQIQSYKLPEESKEYLAVSIGGGNVPYWTRNPKFIRTIYKVQFSKEGEGYIIIDVCKINTQFEIRSVYYGLPVSRKDCQQRIQEIINGMLEVIKASMPLHPENDSSIVRTVQ